jgi:hypothetical protein
LVNTYQHAIDSLTQIQSVEDNLENENNYALLNRLSAYLGKTEDEVIDMTSDTVRAGLFKDYKENL